MIFKGVKSIDMQNVLQILVEVHGDILIQRLSNLNGVNRFMKILNTTHSVFYAEPNIEFSDGNCIEFSMRMRQNLVRS